MPVIRSSDVEEQTGSRYPKPFNKPCEARIWQQLAKSAGLTQFGVNRVRLVPGTWSSQRHWHALEDEFVYVISGSATLVTDEGEQQLTAGDCAAFPAGEPNGHCFKNHSETDVELLVIGSRNDDDHGEYSDIDMVFGPDRYQLGGAYQHKNGEPY